MNLFSRSLIPTLTVGSLFFGASALATPSISTVTPTAPTANVPTTMQANVTSGVGIQSCHLYVESEDVGEMSLNGSTASLVHTFTRGGVHTAFVFCRDNSNGIASGPNTSINVVGDIQYSPPMGGGSNPPPTPTPTPTPTPAPSPLPAGSVPNTLIKLPCPVGATADHVCKAVYYIGADGKRHAFPNSRVFFTWYNDFNTVKEVSVDTMGSITLGKNVTYRPGTRMVKFTTDPKVYVVARGGILRWIKTEEVAKLLFGNTWNTKVDDLSDTFYTNYAFGADVSTNLDYNVNTELSQTTNIDANW